MRTWFQGDLVQKALHTKLKMHAAAQGKSIKDIMTDLIEAL